MSIKLIVGLNNPGSEYEKTRHNAGAWFLAEVAKKYSVKMKLEKKFKGMVGHIKNPEVDAWLLEPNTFMNLSGDSILAIDDYYQIDGEDILVAYDDMDLEPGVVKLKFNGGTGGHNGINDTVNKIGKNFFRLRIGVGRPPAGMDASDYVLKQPSKDDRAKIDEAIAKAVAEVDLLFAGAKEEFMNRVHTDGV